LESATREAGIESENVHATKSRPQERRQSLF
jgi:hypothetical protein